jgi:hypothetical protein
VLSGNEICFHHSGYAVLANYTRTFICSPTQCWQTTWDHAVRSYFAGSSPGAFPDWDGYGTYYFQAWERADYAGETAQNASVVWLALY